MYVFLAGRKIPKTKVAAGKTIASGESVYTRWKTSVNRVVMLRQQQRLSRKGAKPQSSAKNCNCFGNTDEHR
jgi:hypothetical protein